MPYIVAIDQGTTSCRAIAFDESGEIVCTEQQEFAQHFPHPGWVEHDANEIWETQLHVMRSVLNHLGRNATVSAIGITNQRETTVVWHRGTGRPVSNAIVWQDRRTANRCDELKRMGKAKSIQQKTGLVLDAYFSATKVQWILDHVEGARALADQGELAFGTIDSWLIWNLTGGKSHVTDVSNASRTMLLNIHNLEWDNELLELFEIPRSLLPTVVDSSGIVGTTTKEKTEVEIPFAGIAGDQQSALFGQLCLQPGMLKTTYGTGCFMLLNVGNQPVESNEGLLSTVAWNRGDGCKYALEGSVFTGGSVVQWLRDELRMFDSSEQISSLASQVENSGGVYCVPAFTGLGAPHWDQYARGLIVGLTRGSNRFHLARAALEGIAFQVADVLDCMKSDFGEEITELRVDGGAAANNLLMQFQSDILGIPIVRPKCVETTALGAAYLAGLAVGQWQNPDEIIDHGLIEREFKPQLEQSEIQRLRKGWRRAVERAKGWATE